MTLMDMAFVRPLTSNFVGWLRKRQQKPQQLCDGRRGEELSCWFQAAAIVINRRSLEVTGKFLHSKGHELNWL